MSASGGIALELRDVRKRFGAADIIRGASIQVRQGEKLALIGPNGAGKSTLFNLVSGGATPDSGEIFLAGVRIDGRPPHEINRLGLSRSFQVTNIFHRLSVLENLRCAVLWSLGYRYSFWHRLAARRDVGERVDTVMARVGLTHRHATIAGELTYAEQRALEIGIAQAGGAHVLLLDEPTAGMSRSEADAAIGLIRAISVGKTLLMVEHDMSVVFELADRIAVLVAGEIIACGTPHEIRANREVQQAYLGAMP